VLLRGGGARDAQGEGPQGRAPRRATPLATRRRRRAWGHAPRAVAATRVQARGRARGCGAARRARPSSGALGWLRRQGGCRAAAGRTRGARRVVAAPPLAESRRRWAARTSVDPYPSPNPNPTPNSTPNPNLNANPTPTPTPTLTPSPNPKRSPSPGADGQIAHAPAALHAQGGWPVAELRAALAAASGVDAERLRVAKPPAAASGKLSAQALSALRWDEPKLMTTPKISMYPLQLRDGDLLLVRDAEHPPPAAAAAAAAGPGGARGRAARGRGARGGARGGGGVSCAFVGKPRREEGIRIHTVFDQPPAAASEATPAAKEVQETMDDVLVGVEKLEVLD